MGGPLRSGTQLERRIGFTFGKGAHHSPVVEPLGAAICLTSGPKARFPTFGPEELIHPPPHPTPPHRRG